MRFKLGRDTVRYDVLLLILLRAAVAMGSSAAAGDAAPRIYLIRHAESRWNRSFRQWNAIGLVAERDHGLSQEGVEQGVAFAARLTAALADQDQDALVVADPSTPVLSSPLTRAIETAVLGLSLNLDSTAAVDATGSKSIVLVPEARESHAHWLLGRDCIGSPTSQIPSRVTAELQQHGKDRVVAAADAQQGGALTLDLRQCAEVWWTPGEQTESVDVRLKALLHKLLALAEASPTKAVVLTTHSLLIRRLFKTCLEGSGENDPAMSEEHVDLGTELASESVCNCGCIAVDLLPGGFISRPRLVFGTPRPGSRLVTTTTPMS